MKTHKLIIFDLDGTLVDAYRAISASFNFTMRALGLPPQSHELIRRSVGWGDRELLSGFVGPKDLKRALLIYRRHHRASLVEKARLLPYAQKALLLLQKKGFSLAIASNRPTRFSLILLKTLKIKKYFRAFLCKDKVRHGKPHPEIILTLMRRLGFSRSETVYVGDMRIDALAGKRAGVYTVMVTTGSSSESELRQEHPDKLIRSLNSLPRAIREASLLP